MGYFLGWIESLAAFLLLLALATACSARLSRRWLRILLPSLAALLPFLAGLALSVVGVFVMRKAPMHNWIFYSMSPWTVAFAVGAVIVLRRGLRARANVPPAEAWPRVRLAIATGVAILACAMTLWNINLAAQSKLAAMKTEAGALALSVAPSRPPDSQNAALIYEKASELIGEDTRIPQYSDDAEVEELQAFIREHEPALRLLRQAAAMPGCCFEYPLAIPSALPMAHWLDDMRQGARLLALDARVQAAQGQAGPALADVSAIFAMSRHVGDHPLLFNVLVAISIGSIGHSTLEAVLADCDPSEADLAGLTVDEVFSYWRLFHRSMRMERAYGLSMFADLPMSALGAPFMLRELSGYRDLMVELDRAVALPYPEAVEGMKRLKEAALEGRLGVFAALLYPALHGVATHAARAEALHRLDNLALAATAYRIKHGAFPPQPDDLVPEFLMVVPKDPFDGEPNRMVSTDEGILFYSIGADMEDNGGLEWDDESKTGDLTFRLRMPSAQSPRNGAR